MLSQVFNLKALSWIIWMNCLKLVTQSRSIPTIRRFSAHTEENSRDCVSMSQATSSGCFCSDSFHPEFCKITYFTFSRLFAEKSSMFECPTAKSSTSPTSRDIMLSLLWIKIIWRHWKTNVHHLGTIQTLPETKQYTCPTPNPISFTHASTKQILEILLQLLFLWKDTISNFLSLFILCNCWPAISTASVTLELLHKLKAKGVFSKR